MIETSILMLSSMSNNENTFFNCGTGKRCAIFAPNGAHIELIIDIKATPGK